MAPMMYICNIDGFYLIYKISVLFLLLYFAILNVYVLKCLSLNIIIHADKVEIHQLSLPLCPSANIPS